MNGSCSVMLIAGEASGDHYGGALVRRMLEERPAAAVWGMGGAAMRSAGMEILRDIAGLDVMGFWDVLTRYFTFRRVFSRLRGEMERRRPDVVVLIDYPGFNIPFARAARAAGIPVVYFISPKVWAWRSSRIKVLAETVTKMLVFFDFEVDVYRGSGLDVTWIGHPLCEELEGYAEGKEAYKGLFDVPAGIPLVGILPGSREREVRRMFPVMLDAASRLDRSLPEVTFAAGCAPSLGEEFLHSFIRAGHPRVRVVKGKTRELMAASDALMITSGTATLEAALIGTPHVVCYRVGTVTYWIVKSLLRTDTVGLANIAAGRKVVEELLQRRFTPRALARETERLLKDSALRERMEAEFASLRDRLKKEDAYGTAVREIFAAVDRGSG